MAQKVEAVVAEDRKEIFVRGDRQWRRPDWRGLAPLAEDEVFPAVFIQVHRQPAS